MKLVSRFFLILVLAFSGSSMLSAQGPLVVNAGTAQAVCPGATVTLGGSPTASGGTAPYTYLWYPSTGVSNTSVANPTAVVTANTYYKVKVTDATGAFKIDSVHLTLLQISQVHTGSDTAFCFPGSAVLGTGNPVVGGLTYTWTPNDSLSSTTSGTVTTHVNTTTTYTLTANQGSCPPKVLTVTVTVHPKPPLDAGPYVVIHQGERATLHGSGAHFYYWTPSNTITYNGTANPDAEPIITTLYTVIGTDSYGCVNSDTVSVIVIPDSTVVLYNTFSPNADGNNDQWYIGNILNYPNCKLDVYNRYGKLVYTKIGYQNDWDGTNLGQALPEATYYFILDLGNGSPPYKGSVTIIR